MASNQSSTQPSNQPPKINTTSTSQNAPSRPHTARPPAPSLFIAPSQNASAVSLRPPPPSTQPSTARIPLLRQRSTTRGEGDSPLNVVGSGADKTAPRGAPSSSFLAPSIASANFAKRDASSQLGAELSREQSRAEPSPSVAPSAAAQTRERTVAQWRTMQNTLNEIDLTTTQAANGETAGLRQNFNRIFPPAHARALEDLRRAQIALAQAWARSEAEDEAIEDIDEREMGQRIDGSRASMMADAEARVLNVAEEKAEKAHEAKAGKPEAAKEKGDKNKAETAREKGMKTMLEEETERDIMLARRRRQANDRYFERVNKGVVDVVAKLEDVANRMRAVEIESKEIWGEDSQPPPPMNKKKPNT